MLIRIVRLSFKIEEVSTFLSIFEESKEFIRAFEGCNRLELLQDASDPSIFMTYSWWDNEAALEVYRHSELFKSTWARTKVLFSNKPIAFSSYSKELLP